MSRPIPDLLLERYHLQELPAPAAQALEREIAGSPAARARLDAMEQSDEDIRARYPPARLVRRAARGRQSRRGWVLAGALASAVVVMLAVMPDLPTGGDRFKGLAGPSLAVYRRTADGSERLASGDIVHAGDLLRVGYTPAGRAYGVILSIDGAGAVTLHLPPSGEDAAALGTAEINLLDSAYELDAAPRIERFYFVTGARPFKVAPVLTAARRASGVPETLPLPAGLEQVTFAVQKEVRK